MARRITYPDAQQVDLGRRLSTTPLRPDVVVAHTIVGTAQGHIGYISQPGRPYDHLPMDCDGNVFQVQDLAYRAAATLEGNPYVIAIETDDSSGHCFADWSPKHCGRVPEWTDAQVRSLIDVMAWCCVRFDIPTVALTTSRPVQRGLAYHRLGCPPGPEWVPDGDRWTSSFGKCCPDNRRIAQFHADVVPGVRALVAGVQPPGDDDMTPEEHDMLRNVASVLYGQNLGLEGLSQPGGMDHVPDIRRTRNINSRLAALEEKVDDLLAAGGGGGPSAKAIAREVANETARRMEG